MTEHEGLSEFEVLALGQPVLPEYKKLFNYGLSAGARLEFFSNGEYRFILGLPGLSKRECEALASGEISTKILRAPAGNPLVRKAFVSFFMFGDFGPVEVYFNPALYEKREWKIRADNNSKTNLISFTCMDTRKWVWSALRLASMPAKWKEALDTWWIYLRDNAENPHFDRGSCIHGVDEWKTFFDRYDLSDLWSRGEYTGVFGEKV